MKYSPALKQYFMVPIYSVDFFIQDTKPKKPFTYGLSALNSTTTGSWNIEDNLLTIDTPYYKNAQMLINQWSHQK